MLKDSQALQRKESESLEHSCQSRNSSQKDEEEAVTAQYSWFKAASSLVTHSTGISKTANAHRHQEQSCAHVSEGHRQYEGTIRKVVSSNGRYRK